MNLKQLIKVVEGLNKHRVHYYITAEGHRVCFKCYALKKIKKTVEAVDNHKTVVFLSQDKDWQKLKKLLGVK